MTTIAVTYTASIDIVGGGQIGMTRRLTFDRTMETPTVWRDTTSVAKSILEDDRSYVPSIHKEALLRAISTDLYRAIHNLDGAGFEVYSEVYGKDVVHVGKLNIPVGEGWMPSQTTHNSWRIVSSRAISGVTAYVEEVVVNVGDR